MVGMLNKTFCIACLLAVFSWTAGSAYGGGSAGSVSQVEAFSGQDLHLSGPAMTSHRLKTGEHVLVFEAGAKMTIGANQYSCNKAVIWLERQYAADVPAEYRARAYLQGNVVADKAAGAKTTDLKEMVVEERRMIVVWFSITGEVFITADQREIADPRGTDLYGMAFAALGVAGVTPSTPEARPPGAVDAVTPIVTIQPQKGSQPTSSEPVFRYPVNISGGGNIRVKMAGKAPDGSDIATIIGRFYIWQKQDENGGVLELQADCGVVYFSSDDSGSDPNKAGSLDNGNISAVYLSGDVLMTEGPRTIRGEQLYFDFLTHKAIVVDAVMMSFDPEEGIPIYVRAEKLRQVAADQFAAEKVVLTTSEFNRHQTELEVGTAVITDTTGTDETGEKDSKTSYDADLHDVRFKVYEKTLLHLPYVHMDSERPDIPIKSASAGHNSRYGFLVETRWYLSRLLGFKEPVGVESTYALDFYDKRGVGTGVDVLYNRGNSYGRTLGYILTDSGEDKLGRHDSRRDIEPDSDLRGRLSWQHRQFLPNNWQLTGEVSYISDKNFMESFYRSEFNVGKEQETLLHLKRTEDNWGFSALGKVRINDFASPLEELPTLEYHRTGQSFLDDRLTLYSDTQLSRYRQRDGASSGVSEQFFSYAATRNEVDMPISVGRARVIPFVAGTVAYEDGLGYYTDLDGGTAPLEDRIWGGEAGVRVSGQPYWKVYPDVKSRLWNLDQMRHLIRPYMTAVGYTQSESPFEQRDTLNVGISQRLQTKRGFGKNRRTVDWMRLNTDVTWVNNSGDDTSGPDRFMWNRPLIPALQRRSTSLFGPRRNSVGADYLWRMTDTTAVLSDMNFDMQSGVVQQFNVGVSRMRWPNLSYYVGSRYLRRVVVTNGADVLERGSNAFVFAISYVLDPRYTLVLSQQYDFDYGATVRNEMTLIRRYHRMFWGITYSADESIDESAIVFSIWPQGIGGLGIGSRDYMGLGGVAGY